MLIVAKQDNVDNLYAIWNTVTDRFLGVNLGHNECIGKLMDYKNCSYEDAKSRVDHPQPFDDIAEYIYGGTEPDYAEDETRIIKDAVRIIINHYKRDNNFRNSFIDSILSAIEDINKKSDGTMEDIELAKHIACRIIGEE